MKWQAKALSTVKSAKWHSLVPFSLLHIAQSSQIHIQTHQPVMYSWLPACQGEMEPFKEHLSPCGCPTSLRNKPQKRQLGQFSAQILG